MDSSRGKVYLVPKKFFPTQNFPKDFYPFLKMSKHVYNGSTDEIDNLKTNKKDILTKKSQQVLKSYQKSICSTLTCKGFLNQDCDNQLQPGKQER
jgi:hypothetical protein